MKTLTHLALGLTALLASNLSVAAQHDLPGNSLFFDGVDDLVRVPHQPSMDVIEEITLEAWVRTNGGDGGIVGLWGPGGLTDKALLHVDGGLLTARIARDGIPGNLVITGPPLVPFAWTHVALTYDGIALVLYVDGELIERLTGPGKLPSAALDLRMGIEDIIFPAPPNFLQGQIDEVRLWRTARGHETIERFVNQTVAPDTEGLVGEWSLDGAMSEQTVRDSSVAGNHGSRGADMVVAADDPVRLDSEAPLRFAYRGEGLAGTFGVPSLTGRGLLQPGFLFELNLSGALGGTTAAFILGFTEGNAPFKGGVLMPAPDMLVPGLLTDAVGELTVGGVWPVLPVGFDAYVQFWIDDAAGPVGYSASNGMWCESF